MYQNDLLIKGKVTATKGITKTNSITQYEVGIRRIDFLRAIRSKSKFDLWWIFIFATLTIAANICIIATGNFAYILLLTNIDVILFLMQSNLSTKGVIAALYISIAECVVYAVICFLNGLYGEVIKQFALSIPLNIVGIVSWTKSIKTNKGTSEFGKQQTIIVRKMNAKLWVITLLLCAVFCVTAYFILGLLNTSQLLLSSFMLTLSVAGKITYILRFTNHWLFGLLSNIITIITWTIIVIGGDLSPLVIAISYVASAINCVYGMFMWENMYRKVAVNGSILLQKRNINIKRVVKLKKQMRGTFTWRKAVDMQGEDIRTALAKYDAMYRMQK